MLYPFGSLQNASTARDQSIRRRSSSWLPPLFMFNLENLNPGWTARTPPKQYRMDHWAEVKHRSRSRGHNSERFIVLRLWSESTEKEPCGKCWNSPGSTSPWPNSPANLEKSSKEEIVAEAKRIIEVRLGPRLL